ncbi:cytochrome P450 71B26-like [Mangifera indica]|uniref:cytochrome P450 71B26-like n=1 Tax=Mangifera indica TaxID=29780 RepID=UPI001CF94131|nr:cytochrome P450 71B26-like [Mangifera indica]
MALDTLCMATLLSLLLIAILFLLNNIKQVKKQNNRLPPGPPKLPILGNLHQLGKLPHQSFWKLSQKYGPVMLLKLGRVSLVVISSAEAAKDVLKIHDLDCCSRPPLTGSGKLSYSFLDVAFAPYGDYWREMRKMCVLELFSLKRVQSFRFIREEEVASLMDSISQSSSTASPVELSEKMYALTGSIVFRMAFGKRFQGSNFDDNDYRFQELIRAAMAVAGGFTAEECFPYVGWLIDRVRGYHSMIERVCHELDDFYQQIINDHLKPEGGRTKQEPEDIIDVMLKIERDHQIQSGRQAQLTRDGIKAVTMNILLGGVDTSASTVVWAMAELARNPKAMKKAQDEVRNCVGNKGRVTEADIDKLEYLKLIIKETLRLHPPAPLLLPRETISHFTVNGYSIYPKTLMQVNAWAIGRDPNTWRKPEEFFPERFFDSSFDFKGQNFAYLPFGAGRRSCPGIHLGLITSELALANLLYCFDWKLPNGMKEEDLNMEEAPGQSVTVSKKTPLNLMPTNYLQLKVGND